MIENEQPESETHRVTEKQDRLKKLQLIREAGMIPFASRYERTHAIGEARKENESSPVRLAGRITLLRNMGKVTFVKLIDMSGHIQLVLRVDEMGKLDYDLFIKIISIGDFVGVEGTIFTTQKGEFSVLVKKYSFLSKALNSLPEKWHGLKDTETKYRKRYLDLIANEDARERFKLRSRLLSELRGFYEKEGFYEIDTPILVNAPSGALAKPFRTHYNALDMDVYLRIAPEIYLKEAIIGGFDKIFEVARVFRNEGMDASHLQEFTMIEHYSAYWDFEQNMTFTERMIFTVVQKLLGSLEVKMHNRNEELVEVDLTPPWKRVSFRELLISDCGIDIDKYPDVESLRSEIKTRGIIIADIDGFGRGNLVDALYKKVSRPRLVDPIFVINHPTDVSPLARKNDLNPLITDRFQLIINGWEIVNAYSELIDPIDQRERFAKQMEARDSGDEEAMVKDDDYVEAMEYGMPPVSGWGMGVERLLALLTQQTNLRDVVLFPLLKPRGE